MFIFLFFFFFQAEDGIRDHCVTGVQTCALPISPRLRSEPLGIAHVDDEPALGDGGEPGASVFKPRFGQEPDSRSPSDTPLTCASVRVCLPEVGRDLRACDAGDASRRFIVQTPTPPSAAALL